uniref:Uncharacterized protein n=1 Tax=Oryza meridionalis TaxID=40149 RepID=A0A0E0DLT0_9ORYZ
MPEISVHRVDRIEPAKKTKTPPPPTAVNSVQTPRMGGGAPAPAATSAGRSSIDAEAEGFINRVRRQWAAESSSAATRQFRPSKNLNTAHRKLETNMSRVERTKEIKISRVERIDDEPPETKTKVIINAARMPRTAGGGGAPPERAAAAGSNIDKASQAYIDRLKQQWAAEEAADRS